MKINTNNPDHITKANQNFSKIARLVDESGTAVMLTDENVMSTSKCLIEGTVRPMKNFPNDYTVQTIGTENKTEIKKESDII